PCLPRRRELPAHRVPCQRQHQCRRNRHQLAGQETCLRCGMQGLGLFRGRSRLYATEEPLAQIRRAPSYQMRCRFLFYRAFRAENRAPFSLKRSKFVSEGLLRDLGMESVQVSTISPLVPQPHSLGALSGLTRSAGKWRETIVPWPLWLSMAI